MLITFALAILNALLAYAMYSGHHYAACGLFIAFTIIWGFLALCYEGRMLNRIKQLEEKVKENNYGS